MPADPQELFDETECICVWPMTDAQRLRIALELRALLTVDPDAEVTAQQLETWATCYACLPGVSQAEAISLAILDKISQALAAA